MNLTKERPSVAGLRLALFGLLAFIALALTVLPARTAQADHPPERMTEAELVAAGAQRVTVCHPQMGGGVNTFNLSAYSGHFNPATGLPRTDVPGHQNDFLISYTTAGGTTVVVNEFEIIDGRCVLAHGEGAIVVTASKFCEPVDVSTVFEIEVSVEGQVVDSFFIRCGQSIPFDAEDVPPGTYELEEVGAVGFTTTFSGDCAGGTITVEAEDTGLLCIITNTAVVVVPPVPPVIIPPVIIIDDEVNVINVVENNNNNTNVNNNENTNTQNQSNQQSVNVTATGGTANVHVDVDDDKKHHSATQAVSVVRPAATTPGTQAVSVGKPAATGAISPPRAGDAGLVSSDSGSNTALLAIVGVVVAVAGLGTAARIVRR